MSFESASGGIVFVVLAAVWLVVAVPSMRDRGIFREARNSERRQARQIAAQARQKRVSAAPKSSNAADVEQWRRDLEQFAAEQDRNQYVAVDPRAWSPVELPAPQTGHNYGQLVQVEFADVVSIEDARSAAAASAPVEFAPETLDEILRRRRANG
jgi:hypothetical protein